MKDGESDVSGKVELPETGNQRDNQDLRSGPGKSKQGLEVGEHILVALSFVLTILTFPISLWLCLKVINDFERGIILRLGHMRPGGPLGPGVYFILPCTDEIIRVDMRTKACYIALQEIITKDPLVLDVDGVLYYRIQNPTIAVSSVTSAEEATKLLVQTTMRNVLGTMYLSHLVCNRENVARRIQSTVDEAARGWGVKVELIEIKNVRTQVKVVPPSEGTPSSKSNTPRIMKEASVIIGNSPVSFQFRCLTSDAPEAPKTGPRNPSLVFSYS
ncbi:stomatin isoform X1 [Pogona vitticeps]